MVNLRSQTKLSRNERGDPSDTENAAKTEVSNPAEVQTSTTVFLGRWDMARFPRRYVESTYRDRAAYESPRECGRNSFLPGFRNGHHFTDHLSMALLQHKSLLSYKPHIGVDQYPVG
jgi:hypothetical protein